MQLMYRLATLLFLGVTLSVLVPVTVSTQESCDSASILPNRVQAGDYGRVTLGGVANRVRSAPSTEGEVLFSLSPGHVFYVIEDPVCTGDIVWLRIDYNGQVGWTAESVGGPDYFVEPIDSYTTIEDTIMLNFGASGLTFSEDGQTLYAANGDSTVTIINVPDGATETREFATDLPILDFIERPDGSGYISIHENGVTVWNLNFDEMTRIFPYLVQVPEDIAVSPDGAWVAFGGCSADANNPCAETLVELFDVETGTQTVLRPDEGTRVTSIAFLYFLLRERDTETQINWITFVTEDGESELWDVESGSQVATLSGPIGLFALTTSIDIIRRDLVIYGGCREFDGDNCVAGSIAGYSWRSGGGRDAFHGLPGAVIDVTMSALTPSFHRVYALDLSGTVTQIDYDPWNIDVDPVFTEFVDIPANVMALSPDGTVLAVASTDALRLYNTALSE